MNIIQTLHSEVCAGKSLALATIIMQDGSAPRGAGSQLLADEKGLVCGTVGGGLVEAKIIQACAAALQNNTSQIFDFAMDGQLAAQSEMICGGTVSVLIEPFLAESAPKETLLAVLNALDEEGCLLVRSYESTKTEKILGQWSILLPDGTLKGAKISAQALKKIKELAGKTEETCLVECGKHTYIIESCLPLPRMIIAGGGHVSRPTASVAALVGFAVHVLDDRIEFTKASRFPDAESTLVVPDYAMCFEPFHVNTRDYIVIVTRGHLFDETVLAQALRTKAGYIGMIGSSRKRKQVYEHLLQKGFTQADLDRVHSPIGLSINAETPEEIAVSIVAECIAHKRKA